MFKRVPNPKKDENFGFDKDVKVEYFSVAKDFSFTPGHRFRRMGNFSAEEMVEDYLQPKYEKLEDGTIMVLDLDGTAGCCAGFLDQLANMLLDLDPKVTERMYIKTREEGYLLNDLNSYVSWWNNHKGK